MTELDADVLVLGGGPAGIWAALVAAGGGARVVLADKGFCGASGPAAHGVTRLWNPMPGAAQAGALRAWTGSGEQLGEPDWMYRVMVETRTRLDQLAKWGYPCSRGELTTIGPDFLSLLRRRAVRAGVRILDHHPALQLLVDSDGIVSGATGIAAKGGFRRWRVRANAVVLATGGCAFRSGSAGTESNTGDGHLMAAEVGAELSGMEFSSAYGLMPVAGRDSRNTVDYVAFYDSAGRVVAEPGSTAQRDDHPAEVFEAMADGKRVYARTTSHTADPIPLRPVLEGTVRGTGGLRITSARCTTTVAGLYAAGDVTTREAITGAASGVGGQSAAWAMASGAWAGAESAVYARRRRAPGRVDALPGAGLSPFGQVNPGAVIGLVQEHTVPLRRSYWRSQAVLRDSLAELDGMWPGAVFGLGGSGAVLLRAREAAAMLAVARWATHSALVRTESRGLHRRTDHPDEARRWQVRLATGGLDDIWVRRGEHMPGIPA